MKTRTDTVHAEQHDPNKPRQVHHDRFQVQRSVGAVVKQVNSMLVGWANYYHLGHVYKAYRIIDRYTPLRLRIRSKHKVRSTGAGRFPYEYLHRTLGLVQQQTFARSLPSAKA